MPPHQLGPGLFPRPRWRRRRRGSHSSHSTLSWTNNPHLQLNVSTVFRYIVWGKAGNTDIYTLLRSLPGTVDSGHTGTGTRIVLVEVTMSTMGPAARWWCRWYFSICIVCPVLTRRRAWNNGNTDAKISSHTYDHARTENTLPTTTPGRLIQFLLGDW